MTQEERDLFIAEHLLPINEEYNRVSKAVDDYEWEGEYLMADFHREELRHIDALKAEGGLYVPRF